MPTPAKPTMRGDNKQRVEEGTKNKNQTRKSNNSKQKNSSFTVQETVKCGNYLHIVMCEGHF